MKNEYKVTRGSGNVFADLGLPNAADHLLKAQIVTVIADTIKRRGFTQSAAAERLGIAQPDVSKLLRGRFDGFSTDRLLDLMFRLGYEVTLGYQEVANENYSPQRAKLALA